LFLTAVPAGGQPVREALIVMAASLAVIFAVGAGHARSLPLAAVLAALTLTALATCAFGLGAGDLACRCPHARS